MAIRILRPVRLLVIVAILVAVLLAGYVALEVLFLSGYRDEHGYSWKGAGFKWHTAMNARDGEAAQYWAKRMIQYSNPAMLGEPERSYHCLAAAHELAGEYEEALALYERYPEAVSLSDSLSPPLAAARVNYKLGRHEEAFRAYCEYSAAREKERRGRTGGVMAEGTRSAVIDHSFAYEKALSPFRTYDEFLRFMRREWEALGRPEEYRQAVEFLEDMAYDTQTCVRKWLAAMDAGDAEAAKEWARRLIRRSSDSPRLRSYDPQSRTDATRRLAAAHELAGEYEEALALQESQAEESLLNDLAPPLAEARVEYKRARMEEAFRGYCQLAAAWKRRYGAEVAELINKHSRTGVAELMRTLIVGDSDRYDKTQTPFPHPYQKALSPFRSYDQFLDFMRNEWEKTGSAPEYREPMEFLESLD